MNLWNTSLITKIQVKLVLAEHSDKEEELDVLWQKRAIVETAVYKTVACKCKGLMFDESDVWIGLLIGSFYGFEGTCENWKWWYLFIWQHCPCCQHSVPSGLEKVVKVNQILIHIYGEGGTLAGRGWLFPWGYIKLQIQYKQSCKKREEYVYYK